MIPLWIPPLTGLKWLVRYDLYCSHKSYYTSEPPFSSTKGYLSSITSVRKLLSIRQFDNSLLINLLMTILPSGNPLAYQSLVNIPPAQLRSHIRSIPEENPGTCNPDFLFCDFLPAVPALSSRNIYIWTSLPDPINTFRARSTDAAKRRPTLGVLSAPGPHQDCGRAQPWEYYAPTERV